MNEIRKSLLSLILLATSLLSNTQANAALEIEISGGGAQQIPIAILPYAEPTGISAKDSIHEIVAADLKRSGLFRVLDTRGMANLPTAPSQIKYAEWSALQAQAMTVGHVENMGGGRLKVSFQLMDVLKQTQLMGMDYQIAPTQIRSTAHKIADVIYEKLTGEKGIFSSRIAY
ncbi:MAG: Tol-Pal system protein TolB, partial [Methylotenera sp.]|nr:Tol-Pal system protein TolB [Methylotenera sp.]